MAETLFQRFGEWLVRLLTQESEGVSVDIEYIRHRDFRYVHVTEVDGSGEAIRCVLCGRYYPVEEAPEAFQHIADHNDQIPNGQINPFAIDYLGTLDPQPIDELKGPKPLQEEDF